MKTLRTSHHGIGGNLVENFKMKNNIKTQSYFVKRLRDCGFITIKLFDKFDIQDPRKWSIMVDPEGSSVVITCYENKGDVMFEFDDGGRKFPKKYNIKTLSMEIVVTNLIEKKVSQVKDGCGYVKNP